MIVDDLFVKRLATYFNINSSNIIEVIIYLNLGIERTIKILTQLLDCKYMSPISRNLFLYFSNELNKIKSGDEVRKALNLISVLLNKMWSDSDYGLLLFKEIYNVHEEKIILNKNLTDCLNEGMKSEFLKSIKRQQKKENTDESKEEKKKEEKYGFKKYQKRENNQGLRDHLNKLNKRGFKK